MFPVIVGAGRALAAWAFRNSGKIVNTLAWTMTISELWSWWSGGKKATGPPDDNADLTPTFTKLMTLLNEIFQSYMNGSATRSEFLSSLKALILQSDRDESKMTTLFRVAMLIAVEVLKAVDIKEPSEASYVISSTKSLALRESPAMQTKLVALDKLITAKSPFAMSVQQEISVMVSMLFGVMDTGTSPMLLSDTEQKATILKLRGCFTMWNLVKGSVDMFSDDMLDLVLLRKNIILSSVTLGSFKYANPSLQGDLQNFLISNEQTAL